MDIPERISVVVIGAGPAGLTAARQLVKRNAKPLVVEKSNHVGGISRTEIYKGYRFDIGGHRFFTKVKAVETLWQEELREKFILVPRLSRIFYKNQFYSYPLELRNTLANLGVRESLHLLLSYMKWQVRPHSEEENFEQWITNRFGKRLFLHFFKTYTEKVWGVPCNEIQAEWAVQRIKGLSLASALWNALSGATNTKSLIKEFQYPILGPGMMWERFQEVVERGGGRVEMNTDVVQFRHEEGRVQSVILCHQGTNKEVFADQFLSSMPITELVARMDPPPPDEVLAAVRQLTYRDLVVVGLIVNRPDLFPDNWIYIHSPDVQVGRIQNFKNWSAAMVPDSSKTSLGMEYFCTEGDTIWSLSDPELITLAAKEIVALGMADTGDIEDGFVIRQPKAYPVYDSTYRKHLDVIREYLSKFVNLQTIGRNGMHRYNNQDHSMLTALLAVENLYGGRHDLWAVNTERSYHEERDGAPEKGKKN